MDLIERYRGSLVGLAAGDALGTTIEFAPPGTFAPVTDIVGGGPFRLAAGEWTDDTSMALCLAESLVERRGFDGTDQLARYVRWWREGHLSSNGRCFDIGNTVRDALLRFEDDRVVPGAQELGRGREPRHARADDDDALARARHGRKALVDDAEVVAFDHAVSVIPR